MNAPIPAPEDMAAEQNQRRHAPSSGPALSLGPSPWTETAITIDGENIRIHDIAFRHPGSARYLEALLERTEPEVAANVLRRALVIGLVIVMTTDNPESTLDTHGVTAALEGFAGQIATTTTTALEQIDAILTRASETEQSLAETARVVLCGLPDRVDTILANRLETRSTSVTRSADGQVTARAVAERVDAALRELSDLERLRSEAHRAKAAIDQLLTTGQDVRENLRVNLIEAAQLLRR